MPGASRTLVPLYRIVIDGMDLDPVEADFVHQIKITDFLRLPDICTLQVGYPAATEGNRNPFQKLDDSVFEVGAALEVKLGATSDRTTKTIFKGEIVTVEPDFQAGGASMVVRAYDQSHRMMRSRKQRTFMDVTISDIVKKVCQEHGLSPQVDSSGEKFKVVVQNSETDWDFLWRLAQRIGFELTVDDKKAVFKKPSANDAPVELAYPEDLHAFRPRVTAVQQVETVNVRGWDSASKRVVVGTESSPIQVTEAGITRQQVRNKFPGAVIEIGGQSFSSSQEAKDIATATLNQLANAYLAAEGECDGNPLIKAGTRIKIAGVGEKFSGTYRVAKAVHMLTTGGYTTQFSNSAGEHTLLGQSGGANGGPRRVDSIVIGVVTNNNDPDAMGRVKVMLPSVSEVETFWAPVLLPAAGKERGVSMLPRVDEQVIVAFENGDPSYPVVLGSMFNGRDKPGSEMAVTDGSFALKSDENVLVAAAKDINLRSDSGKWDIKIDGGEVTEKVQKGYTGEFGAAWNLKATGGITVESSQSVTIKAPSITVEAQASLALKGATVDINGSGAVTIAGAIINIG
jgi:phage protein D/phage baseplate assembly protein gpV